MVIKELDKEEFGQVQLCLGFDGRFVKLGGTFSCHIDMNEVVLVGFRWLVSVAKYNEIW